MYSPVNFCPPENGTLPCPAPAGAVVPWQPSPAELALPAAADRRGAVQVGTKLLYIGGSDGKAASADVFVATDRRRQHVRRLDRGTGTARARADAATIFSVASIYVIGGADADGKPTTTVWSLTPDAETGALVEWKTVDTLVLPEARALAAVAAAADGLILVGGIGPSGPVATTWKSSFDSKGALTKWVDNQPMPEARSDHLAAVLGDYLWVYGGSDPNGNPTATVLRGSVTTPAADPDAPAGTPAPSSLVSAWATTPGTGNLPVARTDATGYVANGAMYLVGGSDGSTTKRRSTGRSHPGPARSIRGST